MQERAGAAHPRSCLPSQTRLLWSSQAPSQTPARLGYCAAAGVRRAERNTKVIERGRAPGERRDRWLRLQFAEPESPRWELWFIHFSLLLFFNSCP